MKLEQEFRERLQDIVEKKYFSKEKIIDEIISLYEEMIMEVCKEVDRINGEIGKSPKTNRI